MVWASVPAGEVRLIVFAGVDVMFPVADATPQLAVNVTVKLNVPAAAGVPLMVTTLAAQVPLTPAGNPEKVAPFAPVVAYVIFTIGELMQTVCASVPGADVRVIVAVDVPGPTKLGT